MASQSLRFTLKLWQYIIIAQTLLGLLTLVFVIVSFSLNQKILLQILLESSQNIFNEETRSQLSYNWVQQNHIQQSIEFTFQKNEQVSRLQEIISKLPDFQTIQPNPCMQDYRYVDQFCFVSTFCYAIFNEKAIEKNNLQLTLNLTSILTQYRPELLEPSTYFTIDDGSKFFTLQTSGVFPKNYDPQKRPWYLSYQQSEQKDRIFGDPYILFASKKVSIPLIAELKHDDKHQGVIVTELNLKSEIQDSENLNMLIYIVDQKGMIVYGKQYLNKGASLIHIYDTDFTGFNSSDWIQMQMYISSNQFNNTCQNPQNLPQDCLCLYNSIENADLILQILPIYNSPYYLVTYKYNDTIFEKQNELIKTINQTFNQDFNDNILIFLLSYLSITFISYMLTQIIMQQTNLVIKYTNSKSNGKISQYDQDNLLNSINHVWICSKTINTLFQSLQNLLKLSRKGPKKQSTEKIQIESFQYPKKNYGIQVYLSHISEIIELDIPDNHDDLDNFNNNSYHKQLNDVIHLLKISWKLKQ